MDPSELSIGSARGGRRKAKGGELMIEVVRGLEQGDMELLAHPPPVGSTAPTIQSLRASHHELAKALALGQDQNAAAAITGYSPSRISILKADPAFRELVSHYQTKKEAGFTDVVQRLQTLGLTAVEELSERLETKPAGFTSRELMEITRLGLMEGRTGVGQKPGASGPVGGPGVNIQVNFVKHNPVPGPGVLTIDSSEGEA